MGSRRVTGPCTTYDGDRHDGDRHDGDRHDGDRHDPGPPRHRPRPAQANALSPVIARPTIRVFISRVPS